MKTRSVLIVLAALALLAALPVPAGAVWVWTPQTNRWENPTMAVKDTPAEQLTYALGFYHKKQYRKATREFRKLLKHYPKAREAAEAQFYLAKILEDKGNLAAAFKGYQTVVEKYPFSERFPQIAKIQYEIGNELMEGKGGTGFAAQSLVVKVFRTVIKNAPYGPYAAPSQYKIGLYLQGRGMYQDARDEFEKTMNDYPDSKWAKSARYRIALLDAKRSAAAPYDQKVTNTAIKELEPFVADNPDAALSKEAKQYLRTLRNKEAKQSFLVAEFYEKNKHYAAAKIYYNKIVDDYGNTAWAARALKKIQHINQVDQQ
jgi:outer membrane assembly lipoprotein YfiO